MFARYDTSAKGIPPGGRQQKGTTVQTSTIYFDFNTAFSGVSEDEGKWKKEEHDALAKKLRGMIMQLDGINGMNIERYKMTVEYVRGLLGYDQVVDWVQKCVQDFAFQDRQSFPLRGDDMPNASIPVATPEKRSDYLEFTVTLNSDLVSSELGSEAWKEARSEVAAWLMHANGARGCDVYQREITIRCDRREFTKKQMLERVRLVLEEMRTRGRKTKYFPFLDEDKPVIVRKKR